MNENTCTFGGGTIVLLDSFQIYVNNNFILKWFTEMVTQWSLRGSFFCHCKSRFIGTKHSRGGARNDR